jgi:superfamily I DNA and/or RNA helicase
MEFLYSASRLNVATSRARCLCIFVANPKLFEPECRTLRLMKLANAFCRYLEMVTAVDPWADAPQERTATTSSG